VFPLSAILANEEYGQFSGKPYKSDSPNRRFSVRADQKKGYGKFDVQILATDSHTPLLTFCPKARFIGAAWSHDSKFVAIEENRSVHHTAVLVFAIVPQAARALRLPRECDDESAAVFALSTRNKAQKYDSMGFHWTSEGLQIVKWSSPNELVLSASGLGWWGQEAAKETDLRFLAEYELTLRFSVDGTSSLQKITVKKYEEM
jgi:hypothetical protein